MNEREQLESRLRTLIADLTAPSSPIGDWKHIKYAECTALGIESYSKEEMMEYYNKRKEARALINKLEKELKELDENV